MPTRRLLLLPLLLAAAGPRAATAGEAPDHAERIRALVAPYLDARILVGGSIGVVHDGRSTAFGFGRLADGTTRAPDEDTLYEIGSITKVFTGILLADLARDGTVRLDQPVRTLLPDDVGMPRHGKQEITLLHLATHTSGLPRMPSNFAPGDPANPYADYDTERLYAWLRDGTLARAPGERSVYSNLGMGLLGHVLARAGGRPYEELLRERVLDPLGMTATTITLGHDARGVLAPGYDADLDPAANWDLDALAGAGALRSSARDMLRFLEANLADDGPLRASLDRARAVHHTPADGGGPAIGLGWHTGKDGRGRWHNGQTGGYHAFLALDRARGLGVVVLANTATMEVDALGRSILALLAGEPVGPPTFRREVPVEAPGAYVGTYRIAPGFVAVVSREGGRLRLQWAGQPRVALYAASDDVFFLRVVDAEVRFRRGADASVTGFVLHQGGRKIPAVRE